MNKTNAVIFDMDGVLVDSEPYIALASKTMFKETYGVDVNQDDFLAFSGQGENNYLSQIAIKYDIKEFNLERDKERVYTIYENLVKGVLKPFPGSIEFLHRCRELGLKTALATSADRIKMLINMEALGLINTEMRSEQVGLAAAIEAAARNKAFDVMVNALDVEKVKPHPDLFLEAALRLDEEPANCWVIEDSISGIKAAKAAGMRCLALLTSFPKEQIEAENPDKIAKDLSAIQVEDLSI